MTTEKFNARDCAFQIQNPSGGAWVDINGINTFTKSHSEKETDTTTFSSGGDSESQVMERTKTLKVEGFKYKDPSTGALDPGQQLVTTLGNKKGDDSLGGFRFAAPGDTTYEVWTATVKLGDDGGGNNDKNSWSVTFTRSGPDTTAPRP